MLIHYARKGIGSMRPGQALRGSSELHAWGDCNLYLRRHNRFGGRGTILTLEAEHRAAANPPPIRLQFTSSGAADDAMRLGRAQN